MKYWRVSPVEPKQHEIALYELYDTLYIYLSDIYS